jgi:hypothetical protein
LVGKGIANGTRRHPPLFLVMVLGPHGRDFVCGCFHRHDLGSKITFYFNSFRTAMRTVRGPIIGFNRPTTHPPPCLAYIFATRDPPLNITFLNFSNFVLEIQKSRVTMHAVRV